MDLSVIIPVYNESENVADICESLDGYALSVPFSMELVFVDDGSKDDSVALLKNYEFKNASAKVITLSKNCGSHAAMRAGTQRATAGNCMYYFMDMRTPEIIERFYNKLKEGHNAVYGIRKGYKESFSSKLFSKLMRRHIMPEYPREGIGCFIIDEKIKNELNSHVEAHSSIYLQVFGMGFNRAFLNYEAKDREKGVSKWTFSKKFKMFIDSYVAFSYAPIKAVTTLGLILAFIGIIYAIVILVIKLFNIMPLAVGWPTLICVILICFGMTNIALGIIAEYLWRTLDSSRGRPVFIINEEINLSDKKGEEK